MRKLVLAISMFGYIAVTCGVVVNFHYCMDKLASINLFGTKTDKCGLCGMSLHGNNGCCHDEVKVFKLQQDQHKTPVHDYSLSVFETAFVFPSVYLSAPTSLTESFVESEIKGPPLLPDKDITVLQQVFRI